jgi:GDP-4-dehydro-6-deoxy-D-mannose reductase
VNDVVLITGSAGFGGTHLLQRLSGRHELVAWARSSPPPEFRPLARWHEVDLLDRDRVRSLVRELRPAAVFHLAGSPHVPESFREPATAYANNVLATHHLFDALRRAGTHSRVLVTGSAAIYGSSGQPLREDSPLAPVSPYAVSKLAQEQLGVRALREDGIEVILTRPFNHTGPRQRPSYLAPSIARQIALIERRQLEPVLRVGNTSAVRDLSDVRDVVRAYERLMDVAPPGVVFNIASGVGRSVQQIIETLLARSTVPVRIEVEEARLRATDLPHLVGDATRLEEATGWKPEIPFEQTIDDLLEYWRGHA